MAEKHRPLSPQDAPDPSFNYERSHPERESGMGRQDNNTDATPTETADSGMDQATPNKQENRQLNAHDVINEGSAQKPKAVPAPEQPDHSMLDEEPDGWDLAPNDIKNPREKRHPRTEGKGGTP